MSARGGDVSMFPWLQPTKKGGHSYGKSAEAELAHRAALLYRLGFSEAAATSRLCARVGWEFDPACGAKRPGSLSNEAVAKIVSQTYARRPKG